MREKKWRSDARFTYPIVVSRAIQTWAFEAGNETARRAVVESFNTAGGRRRVGRFSTRERREKVGEICSARKQIDSALLERKQPKALFSCKPTFYKTE